MPYLVKPKKFLHQDDGLWPIPRPHPHFLCNALIALDDFGVENGATHLVPYIHQWHDLEVDQSAQTIQVEMKAGSMVLRAGAMWHAGGANTSQPERMGVFISHGVSYLRPKSHNLFLSRLRLSKRYQKRCSACSDTPFRSRG